jgi:hypothetical protein
VPPPSPPVAEPSVPESSPAVPPEVAVPPDVAVPPEVAVPPDVAVPSLPASDVPVVPVPPSDESVLDDEHAATAQMTAAVTESLVKSELILVSPFCRAASRRADSNRLLPNGPHRAGIEAASCRLKYCPGQASEAELDR